MDASSRAFFFGTIGVAVLAGLYIFCSPSKVKHKRKRTDKVRGLQNFGNACFINAILQALAACPSVMRWLTQSASQSGDSSQYLTCALLRILKALNTEEVEALENLSPLEVINALKTKRWVITDEQQDAHEFFHVLTTTLEEEDSQQSRCFSLVDVKSLEEPVPSHEQNIYTRCAEWNTVVPKHLLPTSGLLASQLQCKNCGNNRHVQFDPFNCISVSIPASMKTPITLQDCLRHFVSMELVNNVSCDKCTKKAKSAAASGGGGDQAKDTQACKSTFIKQLKFGKLPRCLCIHIQRTVWLNNGMPMKRHEHVVFPEILAMDEYVYSYRKPFSKLSEQLTKTRRLIGGNREGDGNGGSVKDVNGLKKPLILPPLQSPAVLEQIQNASLNRSTSALSSCSAPSVPLEPCIKSQIHIPTYNHVYKLTAVIVHMGGVFSGHFVTYRRGPVDGQQHRWYYTSDMSVFEAPFNKVLQVPAYMLLYERIPQNPAAAATAAAQESS